LPPLPAGTYRVLGEIVRESRYAETLAASVTLPDISHESTHLVPLHDPHDAWLLGNGSTGDSMQIAQGIIMHWRKDGAAIRANVPAPLNFAVTDEHGVAVDLEPYMGMAAHAIISRDDDSVFVHLHPSGT